MLESLKNGGIVYIGGDMVLIIQFKGLYYNCLE